METVPVLLNVETALAACRGDSTLARALIEQYCLDLPAERAEARALDPPDWEAIRERAHRLRSGSAYLGAERIAAAARDLEAGVLARRSPDALAVAWRTLERAFEAFSAVPIEDWEKHPRVVNRLADGAGA